MAVPTQLSDLSATAASNSPAGGDTVGTTMDDFIRAHASIIARISAGTDALATPNIGAATGTSLVLSGLATVNGAFTSRGIDDNATAVALTLSGSGANSVTIANSASNPTIGTSGGALQFSSAGNLGLIVNASATSDTWLQATSPVTGNNYVALSALGTAADVSLFQSSKGSGNIVFYTGTLTTVQAAILHTASANRYITLTGSNGDNPTIGTSAGALQLAAAGDAVALCVSVASAVNLVQLQSSGTGTPVYVYPSGASSDANVDMVLGSKGTGAVRLLTGGALTEQVRITHTASADRYITLTGSNGGNPTIGTSAGSLALSSTTVCAGDLQARAATATPAGGMAAVYMGTNGYSIGFGSGAPTYVASKGSLYLRSDGSATNNRMYVATDSAGTWTAVTTAA